jgi:IS4 transposase
MDFLPMHQSRPCVNRHGAYLHFKHLYLLHQCMAFFIIRSKRDTLFRRLSSHRIDKTTGLRCDQTMVPTGTTTKTHCPDTLRRVKFFDEQTDRSYSFLTNNFIIPAFTITELYRRRWQVELFFKWIKHHLCIKAFYGTGENAVKTQIWIAVSVYGLVAIVKKQLRLDDVSLYTMLQILSITLFKKAPLLLVLTAPRYNTVADA